MRKLPNITLVYDFYLYITSGSFNVHANFYSTLNYLNAIFVCFENFRCMKSCKCCHHLFLSENSTSCVTVRKLSKVYGQLLMFHMIFLMTTNLLRNFDAIVFHLAASFKTCLMATPR